MLTGIESTDVILRDGSTLRLSPPVRGDAAALVELVETLSLESRFMRFHGLAAAGDAFVQPLIEPDWVERGALVGKIQLDDGERIVALGNYVRLRDAAAAEVAFIVADAFQQRGIGTRLLEQLAERAGAAGIERFVAYVLPGNRGMLDVLTHVGFRVERSMEGGIVEASVAIAATDEFVESVDERDRVGVVASLRPFFEPRSVAVLGASPRPGSIGGAVFRNVVAGGFDGPAYPVNRDGSTVAGVEGHRSVSSLPEPVDLAVVALPAHLVLAAVEEVLDTGTRALCVISAGFAEVGPEGAARQDELLALVRGHGARLLGPNCLGLFSAGARLNATFAPRSFPPGRVGVSSQSGALGLALLESAVDHGLGFSGFASVGNKADISSNDLLEWWESDAGTDLVVLYLESFGNPRKFARIAPRVARRKPVLAMKSGRSAAGMRAAGSHTAALAGSDRAADALFREAGVTRAETLEELLEVAELLAGQPLPAGPRVAVMTNAGGLGILCADACSAAGLELPAVGEEARARLAGVLPAAASLANPVDMLGSATADHYRETLATLLDDPGCDSVIVLFVPTAGLSAADVASAIDGVLASRPAEKPVLACLLASEHAPPERVATLPYPESAARALGRAVERSKWLRRPAGRVVRPDGIDLAAAQRIVAAATASDDRWLDPGETRALLEAYGLPLVRERTAAGPAEAVSAAADIGLPVAVKTAKPGAHKTEVGGVALDLETPDDVRSAAARIGGEVLVQEMVTGGSAELLLGAIEDLQFGPLVAFGPGGTLAELIGEAHLRLAPLTDVDIDELLGAGRVGRLVAGYRGAPPVDAAALGDTLARLSALADDLPAVAELDLNPVIGLSDRVVVVDARVRVAEPASRHRLKSW